MEEQNSNGATVEASDSQHKRTQEQKNVAQATENNRNFTHGARRELHIHEMSALGSCFLFPILGAWVLHTIRSQLSRPSEGLVSNYNLTIFLLAAEIRPVSHLLKMIQARTLHLQRVVSLSPLEDERIDSSKILDISKRLEELEAHVAEAAAERYSAQESQKAKGDSSNEPDESGEYIASEVRKKFQPELDALSRAIRRCERRTATSSYETDTRLRHLEMQFRVLQQSDNHRNRTIVSSTIGLAYMLVMTPLQVFRIVAGLPILIVTWFLRKIGLKHMHENNLSNTRVRPTYVSVGKRPMQRDQGTKSKKGGLY